MSEQQAAFTAAVQPPDPERTADQLVETLTRIYEEYAVAYNGPGQVLDPAAYIVFFVHPTVAVEVRRRMTPKLEDIIEVQQTCRVCGCTDEAGCEGICYWVAEDLCSSCD